MRPAPRRRRREPGAQQDGPRPRRLLLRHEDPLAPRRGSRGARSRGARAPRLRHRRRVAALEAHGRPRPRHRRDERLAHALPRPQDGRLGRRDAEDPQCPPRGAARRGAVLRCPRRDSGPRLAAARPADRRGRWRPAGSAVRAGVPRARGGQEHLRDRMLHAAQYGAHSGGLVAWALDDDRVADRRGGRRMPSRAAYSSPARLSSGCATGSGCCGTRPRAKRWRNRFPTPVASTSSRRSSVWALPTGTCTRAEPSWG